MQSISQKHPPQKYQPRGYPADIGNDRGTVIPPDLVRAHDPLRRDHTTDPVFLLQRRRVVYHDDHPYEWDEDRERFVRDLRTLNEADGDDDGGDDDDDNIVTDAIAVAEGHAIETWETEMVFFTREEADEYREAKKHRFLDGSRVYCVPAMGRLVDVLGLATEGGRYR